MKDLISRQAVIELIHHTIFDFFDICDDDEETPITYKDEKLLEINKAICTAIKKMPSVESIKHGACHDCISLDSKDDFNFTCKKGKEIDDLFGSCEEWESAYSELKHGRWIDNKVAFHRVCSECGAVIRQDISLVYLLECMERVGKLNYCPNCGAKMDGKVDV